MTHTLSRPVATFLRAVLIVAVSGATGVGHGDPAGDARVALGAVAESPALGQRYEDFMILTVDKVALKADLRTWPEDPGHSLALRSFKIAVGKSDGDKEHEGDNRTPEGIYFAQSHIDGQVLPERYGTMAIPIDFPNPIDQIVGKTGHGIWLHGVDHEQRIEEAKVTEGCVAFYNGDIARLSNWLRGHQSIVVIASDLKAVNQTPDLAAVKTLTREWIDAWHNRMIDSYIGFYAPDFRYGTYDLKGYKDYKGRVFQSYRNMTVAYDSLRVVTHPKYAVSFFNQDFRGDNRFTSIGRKILYWERDGNGGWRIKREVFENRRFEVLHYTDAERTMLSEQAPSMSDDKKKQPNL